MATHRKRRRSFIWRWAMTAVSVATVMDQAAGAELKFGEGGLELDVHDDIVGMLKRAIRRRSVAQARPSLNLG